MKTKTWAKYKIIFSSPYNDRCTPYEDAIPAKSDREARKMFKAWKELHKDSEFVILKLIKVVTVITQLA